MDLNGITNGGVFVPMIVAVAALFVVFLVVRIIRRSAASMARRNQEWIDQLPVSTGSRTAPGTGVSRSRTDTHEILR